MPLRVRMYADVDIRAWCVVTSQMCMSFINPDGYSKQARRSTFCSCKQAGKGVSAAPQVSTTSSMSPGAFHNIC